MAAAEPMLVRFDPESTATEILNAAFLPDAIEALVQLAGSPRPNRWSRRSNATAAGSTGRGCWRSARAAGPCCWPHAATSTAAAAAAHQAMAAHDRLPMPFERARTLLLLGQLQRRQRKKESASASLQQAFDMFEELERPAVGRPGPRRTRPRERRPAPNR